MNHFHMSVQSVFVHRVIFTHTALKSTLLEVYSTNMPLQSKLVCSAVFTYRTLMQNLTGLLMSVGCVSLESTFMYCVIVTSFTSIDHLDTLIMHFALVSFESRSMSCFVITPLA